MAQVPHTAPRDEVRVHVAGYEGVLSARKAAREMAVKLGFTLADTTRVTTAVSEVARNIARFAWSGVVVLRAEHSHGTPALTVEAIDSGPGIADPSLVVEDGYGTADSLGLGLSSARRLMDEFSVVSRAGDGTTVKMRKSA
ncbi:MAG: anti-sigma regulatory factor [Actinomycetota bacterium]|jgi:serine/threonine-protein kinase RsbT|nr:anti-sigma regulatory factor [Actinomycetota bacterium]